ncbi:MAG: LCP family protein [Thermoleophilia bacterium]
MARNGKPYRRFRAKGGDGGTVGDGLDELRALTTRAGGGDAPPRPDAPDAVHEAPPAPPRRPGWLEREQRRELARQGRRWYSLRGLGPGGWAWRIALVLFVGLLAWSGFGYLALKGAVDEANGKITGSARAALDPADGGMLGTPTNTLILGVDARPGEGRGRADTILIMRTDPDSGRIKYLSIPRDWRIELPNHGTQKINAAFQFGGQAGMINAVKRLTGLPINHLMVIKFGGFPKLVDALGGVTVNNPTAVKHCYYQAGEYVSFKKGDIHLDGAQALKFTRVRKCDSDFNRALRQQALMAGLKNRVLAPGNLWRAPWSGASVVRALQTDLGVSDIAKMGWLQARLTQDSADRILLTGDAQTIGGISYVVGTDPDRNEQEIAQFISSR